MASKNSKSDSKNLRAESHPEQDLRQAYENLGRLEILEGALAGSPFVDVNALADLAQQQIDSGQGKNASNLLRAAEHISFAALAPKRTANLTAGIPAELKAAVTAELDRLIHAAQDGWGGSDPTPNRSVLVNIFDRSLDNARQAYDRGAYRPALQFARAAEALSHVDEGLPATMPADRELTRRMAS